MSLFILPLLRVARRRRLLAIDLRRLSDRHLADVGLDRDGIDAHVREALPWPAAPAPVPAFGARLQGCG